MSEFRLRPLHVKDAVRMLEWLHDDETTRFLALDGKSLTLEDTLSYIRNAQDETVNLHRAVVSEDDVYLGTVSLKNIDLADKQAEYAISMHPSAVGSGAAKAASLLIAQVAFIELGLKRVYLNVLRVNQRAVRFYDKLGYRYTHSSSIFFDGKDIELMWYEIDNPTP